MDDPTGGFLAVYEQATNTHDVDQVLALIDPEATYWFTDGSHTGHDEIGKALRATWATIQAETYSIHDVEWVTVDGNIAVSRYQFTWSGLINGEHLNGSGRGTSVLHRSEGGWRVMHEHLSG